MSKLLQLKNHWLVQYQCSSNRIPALMVGLDLSDLSDCLSPFMDHHPISIPYSSQLDFPPLLKGNFFTAGQGATSEGAGRGTVLLEVPKSELGKAFNHGCVCKYGMPCKCIVGNGEHHHCQVLGMGYLILRPQSANMARPAAGTEGIELRLTRYV